MNARPLTRQQQAVATVLDECTDFISAQDLHGRMRSKGSTVGLATVYRALAALTSAGGVDVRRTEDGEALYRKCSSHHHHHLICRECGRTIEIQDPGLGSWTERVGARHGFREVSHTLEIFGRCPNC